jgi:hypothetical protein
MPIPNFYTASSLLFQLLYPKHKKTSLLQSLCCFFYSANHLWNATIEFAPTGCSILQREKEAPPPNALFCSTRRGANG